MTEQHVSILEKFAAEAIRLGAEQLEVEYKDGYEELSAVAGDFGFGIGRLRSTSQEAATLRHELYQCTRRKRQIVVDGDNYELHGRTYDSFGEQAYRVFLGKFAIAEGAKGGEYFTPQGRNAVEQPRRGRHSPRRPLDFP